MDYKIILGGDLCLDNLDYQVDSALVELFHGARYRLLNLEGPILPIPQPAPLPKAGPNIAQDHQIISFLKQLNVTAVSGANNHAMDYEAAGIAYTREQLEQNGIHLAGCGSNLPTAAEPIWLNPQVAVVCTCEEEFGIAEADRPGCYSMYGLRVVEQIRTLKAQGALVLVYPHGGSEMMPVPPRHLMERYHSFIAAGADAVIAHHPHNVQGMELYQGKPIYYSLGNFIHKYYPNSVGALVELTIQNNQIASHRLLPVELKGKGLMLLANAQPTLNYFQQVSALLTDSVQLTGLQQVQAIQMYERFYKSYLTGLFVEPHRSWIGRFTYQLQPAAQRAAEEQACHLQQQLLLLHLVRNASHHEAITTALGLLSGELQDQRTPALEQTFKLLDEQIHAS